MLRKGELGSIARSAALPMRGWQAVWHLAECLSFQSRATLECAKYAGRGAARTLGTALFVCMARTRFHAVWARARQIQRRHHLHPGRQLTSVQSELQHHNTLSKAAEGIHMNERALHVCYLIYAIRNPKKTYKTHTNTSAHMISSGRHP